jgi:hypothetical protein
MLEQVPPMQATAPQLLCGFFAQVQQTILHSVLS